MLGASRWWMFVLVVGTAAGCASGGDTQFNVEYAPGFAHGGSSISILGIFKDGRMSPDSWEDLGPRLTAALGTGRCDIAYSDELVKTNPGLSSAVDDYARANGLTDDLLGRFAPLATGSSIMTIIMAGQVRRAPPGTSSQPPPPPSPPSRRGGGSRGRRRSQAPPGEARSAAERGAFEMSATLFSVSLGHSVAAVSMEYRGSSADEALQAFAEKLASAIPHSTCAGWNWNVHVDEAAIRRTTEP